MLARTQKRSVSGSAPACPGDHASQASTSPPRMTSATYSISAMTLPARLSGTVRREVLEVRGDEGARAARLGFEVDPAHGQRVVPVVRAVRRVELSGCREIGRELGRNLEVILG